METPFGDELLRVVGAEVMPTWNRDRRNAGGEWDYIRSMPLRTRKRLTSAGYMGKHAMGPDKFADLIRHNVPGARNLSDGECHDWYVGLALRALAERRRVRGAERKQRLARRAGASSYYELRGAQARAEGYRSYWHMRKAKGWV
jgi:hypothetical protein